MFFFKGAGVIRTTTPSGRFRLPTIYYATLQAVQLARAAAKGISLVVRANIFNDSLQSSSNAGCSS